MATITIANYKSAYLCGKKDAKNGDYSSYYTPVLEAAYDLGREGIEIDFENIVVAERYGELPKRGVSYNYRDDYKEKGVSAVNIKGEEPVGSYIWFTDNVKIEFEGILLPVKGSDGEPLLLPLGVEQYDF